MLWNTGASWQATKAVKLRAGVQNLLDKDFSRDDYGYNEDGRRYFGDGLQLLRKVKGRPWPP